MVTTDCQRRITVLVHFNRISLFYTLAPLLLTKDVAQQLDFTQSLDYCLKRDRNRALLIVRFFEGQSLHNQPVDPHLMVQLREKYDRIAFFDDGAGAGCTRFEVLPYVDLYLKKHLFRDLSTYRRELYGRQLYTDYYHRKFGVTDAVPSFRQPITPRDKAKLRVTWNLGVGSFPLSVPLLRIGVAAARRGAERLAFRLHRHPLKYRACNRQRHEVHARFASYDVGPSAFFQRQLLLKQVSPCPQFLAGPVHPKRYNEEIRHSKITLSPFGWGEVCFRDFEAVLNDSLLLKPNMDHLTTWPDIYRPWETYVPLSWDGDDVADRAQQFLQDPETRRRIAGNAKDAYYDALRNVNERARTVVSWILGG